MPKQLTLKLSRNLQFQQKKEGIMPSLTPEYIAHRYLRKKLDRWFFTQKHKRQISPALEHGYFCNQYTC